ncbi:MAG: UDP-N-acetylglucosamine 2-epimerase (non-hydrolyzing), partial [Gemmatimonadetes bacterium]|nr:UDP-N-acetyl glucosamine 2-epimerase [Gemmatimonadota bacterium]NIQ52389.1 UDP-N-acetyl glucosamine 2-epimerase [Gemmatimonadota bacterium]NIU72515.1 UDP-N-acetylglucosamine 2-epimerase (non-hydrolyzing) [Gammaproteobacteria bacterium]NIX42948.1 UDP-N-acetylglucosamine 2-epimerase (non-hydrolyzing) [Gemmatimonadota bacterium]NIY07127.1 UDP-N-acetylglucosamine 2-epimerase (non-hydrolyzing) [Gemmatimonadota bacterium]
APLDYFDLVAALRHADLVLTDSGGIQEEAPTFGTPVLVLREVTERPEGIEAGVARAGGHRWGPHRGGGASGPRRSGRAGSP